MAIKYADVNIGITVKFEDNGDDDLKDQAIEAAMEQTGLSPMDCEVFEVLGEVRETELPAQNVG